MLGTHPSGRPAAQDFRVPLHQAAHRGHRPPREGGEVRNAHHLRHARPHPGLPQNRGRLRPVLLLQHHPLCRGRVRSKPLEDIKAEAALLGDHGYREVVLTGINLPAYGKDQGLHLCDAVEAACAAPGIARLRLGSLEPEQLTPEVIARMAKQDKAVPPVPPQPPVRLRPNHPKAHEPPLHHGGVPADRPQPAPGLPPTAPLPPTSWWALPGRQEEEFAASLALPKRSLRQGPTCSPTPGGPAPGPTTCPAR